MTSKPYVLSPANNKAIPVVKIADPKAVNAKCVRPIRSATAHNISDVRFQALRAGKRYHVDTALRSDGRYEVSFNGTGRRELNVFYLDKNGKIVASGGLEVEVQSDPGQDRFMAEYKQHLSLPYDQHFDERASETKPEKLDGIIGLGDFALVPPDGSTVKRRLVEISAGDRHNKPYVAFYCCSPDLSAFLVMIRKPESCRAACDEIWKVMSSLFRRPRTLADMSTTTRLGAAEYTLNERNGQRWHICLKRGLLITITPMWCLRSPANKEVVAAQKDRLMAEVFSVLDNEKPVLTAKDQAYYNDLKAAHQEARQAQKKHTWFVKIPTSKDKFGLTLVDLPLKKPAPGMRVAGAAAPRSVRMGKPYLLARADGKAIPVVKIADPGELGKKSATRPMRSNTGAADVAIQTMFDGEPGYIEAALRTDGRYQVTFPECGKRSLQLLYLDTAGNVVEFGELPVVVEAK